MLEIQTVPDIANCSIVLGDATQDFLDKGDDYVDALADLFSCIDSVDVASLQAMHSPELKSKERPWVESIFPSAW